MRPVILDTDIGSDVDDILALVMLAKSPELQLIGITTVYGDTIHQARIAQATCAMLERPDIKIIAGAPKPISGRQVYWAGHEGEEMQDLESIAIDSSIKAEEYLAANADQCSGELEILAIALPSAITMVTVRLPTWNTSPGLANLESVQTSFNKISTDPRRISPAQASVINFKERVST